LAEGLSVSPFLESYGKRRSKGGVGLRLLLDWLADQPGRSWQERWQSSGADAAGRAWRAIPSSWLDERGHGPWRREALIEALPVVISADLVRPSLTWLVGGGLARGGLLVRNLAESRDPQGFARLRELCEADDGVSITVTKQVAYRSALILAAKGGTLGQVMVGDIVELFAAEDQVLVNPSIGRTAYYRILRDLGVFGAGTPAMLRGLQTVGQRTPEELIDRYGLACRPIRDLLVDGFTHPERGTPPNYTDVTLTERYWA